MTGGADVISLLHVDTDTDFTDMVATFLERHDDRFEVETASNPDAALEMIADAQYDCVVSGYVFRDRTGLEFLEAVRGDHADLPFVLFTGRGSEAVASDAISAGVSEYLQKQSGTEQYAVLANRIENIVSRHRAESQAERYSQQREEGERYRQRLLEVVSDPDRTDDEKVRSLLELGCERFGVENGHLVLVDPERERHEVVAAYGTDVVEEGVRDLSETYCRRTLDSDGVLAVNHAAMQGLEDDPAYLASGIECYFGSALTDRGSVVGTLCFVDEEPREPLTHEEETFFDLLRGWFSHLAGRLRYEREQQATIDFLQNLYEVTTDSDLQFDEKIDRLLEFGCEKLDLPYGFLTRIDAEQPGGDEGVQTIVQAHGDHDLLQPGGSCPLSEAYCRRTADTDGVLTVQDAAADGWKQDPAYQRFGLGCYIGAPVVVEGEVYGTFCFASKTPRSTPFTDAERTFVRLTSRWAGYELARS